MRRETGVEIRRGDRDMAVTGVGLAICEQTPTEIGPDARAEVGCSSDWVLRMRQAARHLGVGSGPVHIAAWRGVAQLKTTVTRLESSGPAISRFSCRELRPDWPAWTRSITDLRAATVLSSNGSREMGATSSTILRA